MLCKNYLFYWPQIIATYMKHCPKCNSLNTVKNGFLRGKQRKRCKDCGYQYTKTFSGKISPDTKRNALELYLEGLGFRSIGRFLGCSHVSVYNWIRSFGARLEPLKKEVGVKVMEIDEMHTYVSSKKTTVGYGLLLIDTERNLSIASLGAGERKRGRSCGQR